VVEQFLKLMTKGVEIKDMTVGTEDEATRESVVVVNVREFLRRGDEVSPSPLFGTRMVIDLGRRDCIAGLRYGIPGMRVGGKREIVISPHLAYGEAGIPGKIPPNALLRCEVELLEIRKYNALLPQDWLPGKALMLSCYRDPNDQPPGWNLSMHEGGNSSLVFGRTIPDTQPAKMRWTQIPIALDAQEAAEVIREAMDLPNQIPRDCVEWKSEFIETRKGGEIRDRRNGVRCLVVQVREDGTDMLIFGVHENSPQFRDSTFYRTIERLIRPHLGD
jgi:FKBP-type peptidyl-prolyl cis-trans isomerase